MTQEDRGLIRCSGPRCLQVVAAVGDFCSEECKTEAAVADRREKVAADLEPPEEYEYVNHPKHYNEHPSGIECIDVIEHMTLNIGTAIKYLWRAGLKPGEGDDRDLQKAIWYIERERTINQRKKR